MATFRALTWSVASRDQGNPATLLVYVVRTNIWPQYIIAICQLFTIELKKGAIEVLGEATLK